MVKFRKITSSMSSTIMSLELSPKMSETNFGRQCGVTCQIAFASLDLKGMSSVQSKLN